MNETNKKARLKQDLWYHDTDTMCMGNWLTEDQAKEIVVKVADKGTELYLDTDSNSLSEGQWCNEEFGINLDADSDFIEFYE